MVSSPLLSVVVPAFNEEQNIQRFYRVLLKVLTGADIHFEAIFIDDGSKDGTWKEITTISEEFNNITGIHFSRNFGKEAAIVAGLSQASGDCCVVIDSDLQHPPETIVEMYRLWTSGYEVIEAQKNSRGKESIAHRFAARSFYSIISKAVGYDMARASDFKLLDRKAINALLSVEERNSFFRALSSWIGFQTATVYFDVQERTAGESKWSTGALIRYAINNIATFSTAPMQIVTILGVILLIVSVLFSIIAVIQKISGAALGGFTTLIILVTFSSSIIMISLGIIGYYIARIFEEVKKRPKYIISDVIQSGSIEKEGIR